MSLNKWMILLCFVLLTTNWHCGKQNEGCTDPAARNFDVSADKNCCCQYPVLQLTYQYSYLNRNLKGGIAGDTLLDAGNHPFTVLNAQLLLSGFSFISGTETLKTDKRFWFHPLTGVDSFLTVSDYYDPSLQSELFTTITYKSSLDIDKINYTIGAADSALLFDPFRIRDVNNPLYPIKGSFYNEDDKKYSAAILDIYFPSDSSTRKYFVPAPVDNKVSFALTGITLKSGFNATLMRKISIDKLFADINWAQMDSLEIVNILTINLKAALE